MAQTSVTDDEKGKTVVAPDGEHIGRITRVEHGAAYVDPDPSIADTIKSKLGWDDDPDPDEYVLQSAHIERVTDDEVVLKDYR